MPVCEVVGRIQDNPLDQYVLAFHVSNGLRNCCILYHNQRGDKGIPVPNNYGEWININTVNHEYERTYHVFISNVIV